ncbi:MAG: glycosyltransferase family 1 protein [Alphaproteobacteria bacterium]|nr:glycosyltransferase family 1 protein [Alphaproteobacteria bacterium]
MSEPGTHRDSVVGPLDSGAPAGAAAPPSAHLDERGEASGATLGSGLVDDERPDLRLVGDTDKYHIVNAAPTMRPGHDGVTRVLYRTRELFRGTEFQHRYVSAMFGDTVPNDMIRVPSYPWPLSTGYRMPWVSGERLGDLLSAEPVDLVHIHSFCPLSHTAAEWANERGIPLVATYHTHFASYMPYYRLHLLERAAWRALRRLYARCQAVIVPSRATMEELERRGFENLIHIPHGVETSQFSPVHRDPTWRAAVGGDDKLIFTFVGRLVWEKSPDVVAQAWHHMRHKDRVKIVFVGGGPAQRKLAHMLPQATFVGQVTEAEVPRIVASSDVFVFPSTTETFGNVTVEAMASGLPVVCGDAGGTRDFVDHGVNGFLVGPEPEAFAKFLDILVENDELRRSMSEAARKKARLYRWDLTGRRYMSLYRLMIRQHTGQARSA